MALDDRRDIPTARRVVVKVGSSSISGANAPRIAHIVDVLAAAYENDETLINMTNTEFGKVLQSEDTKEGLMAFIEKRPPVWQGR